MGRTTDAGYGPEHRGIRKDLKPLVEAGMAWCTAPVCLEPTRWIRPESLGGKPWDLGHTLDHSAWAGPQHARCNRSPRNRRVYAVPAEARQDLGKRERRPRRARYWRTSQKW